MVKIISGADGLTIAYQEQDGSITKITSAAAREYLKIGGKKWKSAFPRTKDVLSMCSDPDGTIGIHMPSKRKINLEERIHFSLFGIGIIRIKDAQ